MIYIVCPTCKRWLADKQEQYDKVIGLICKDIDSEKITPEKGDELKKELIQSFELPRYCCKQRIITYRELVKIVK